MHIVYGTNGSIGSFGLHVGSRGKLGYITNGPIGRVGSTDVGSRGTLWVHTKLFYRQLVSTSAGFRCTVGI